MVCGGGAGRNKCTMAAASTGTYKFADQPPEKISSDIKKMVCSRQRSAASALGGVLTRRGVCGDDTQNELNASGQLDHFVSVALAFLSGDSSATASAATDSKTGSGGAASTPQEMLDAFIVKYSGIKEKVLKEMVASLLFVFTECLKKNLSAADVRDDLTALGTNRQPQPNPNPPLLLSLHTR